MLNIDSVLHTVNSILLNSVNLKTSDSQKTFGFMDVNINISIIGLDDVLAGTQSQKVCPQPSGIGPSIDVFEDVDMTKVVVHAPRLKKESVEFEINEGSVRLLIIANGQIYQKEIPCSVKPGKVVATSTINNSVLELVFKKT